MHKLLQIFKITIIGSFLAGGYLIIALWSYIPAFYYCVLGNVPRICTGIFSPEFSLFINTTPLSLLIEFLHKPDYLATNYFELLHKYNLIKYVLYLLFIMFNTVGLYAIGWLIEKIFYKVLGVLRSSGQKQN